VIASLTGFTTDKGTSKVTETVRYFGEWWKKNVGVSTEVPTLFCDTGLGADQTSLSRPFAGVSLTLGNGEYSLQSSSTPHHDVEDYCSAQGSHTPPLMGTSFGKSFSHAFDLSPSSKSRGDISNEVGLAVNGVVIFSPFTGVGTIAAYDETLDTCRGHPADRKYHYHGFSPCLHNEVIAQPGVPVEHSPIYGWAFDGFPIYGPYGYSDGNDMGSEVVRVTASYRCRNGSQDCATNAEKAVKANWHYSPGSGKLDDCNGRWTKTPQFPNGMYVYVLNVQPDGSADFPGGPYCMQSSPTTSTTAVILP